MKVFAIETKRKLETIKYKKTEKITVLKKKNYSVRQNNCICNFLRRPTGFGSFLLAYQTNMEFFIFSYF